jgi:hypothetical protein
MPRLLFRRRKRSQPSWPAEAYIKLIDRRCNNGHVESDQSRVDSFRFITNSGGNPEASQAQRSGSLMDPYRKTAKPRRREGTATGCRRRGSLAADVHEVPLRDLRDQRDQRRLLDDAPMSDYSGTIAFHHRPASADGGRDRPRFQQPTQIAQAR